MEGVSLNTLVVSIVAQGLGQRQSELIKDKSSDYALQGKWEKFSLEMLIILATKAGMGVTLKAAA